VPERAGSYRAAVLSWKQSFRYDGSSPAQSKPVPPTKAAIPAQPASAPADAPSARPYQLPMELPWHDLANQPAGALAREQAIALKETAPVRTFFARALGVHTDERAWRIGADGEAKVAAQLDRLRRKDGRWLALHSVPVGRHDADIDHIVIGPGGVFVLNAKHHPAARIWVGGNTFMVNGNRRPYIHNSRAEATRASRLLTNACGFPVPVTGIVVPVNADRLTIKTPPRDVHVVNRMALVRWFRRRPDTLSEWTIGAIFDAARRSTAWQTVA
jgi:hypothetical protein